MIYGDVWVCSGQSNMQWRMDKIFNAGEEIAAMEEYPNIRMYFVKLMTSITPQDDLMAEQWTDWEKTTSTDKVSQFSAVCLLTARYMADTLGKDKVIRISYIFLNLIEICIVLVPKYITYKYCT